MHVKDKIDYILQASLNPDDVLDLFSEDLLIREEYTALFQRLDVISLAYLLKTTYPEEFSFHQVQELHNDFIASLIPSYEWEQAFCTYLQTLSLSKRSQIMDVIQYV